MYCTTQNLTFQFRNEIDWDFFVSKVDKYICLIAWHSTHNPHGMPRDYFFENTRKRKLRIGKIKLKKSFDSPQICINNPQSCDAGIRSSLFVSVSLTGGCQSLT